MDTNQPASGIRARPAGVEPLPGLADRTNLPLRVRHLLEGLLQRTTAFFEPALVKALDEFEQELFKLAERARSNEIQQRHFEALREVKRDRADLAPRFLLHVESNLARLGLAPDGAGARHTPHSPAGTELELIDTTDLEEKLALQETAVKAEIRHSQVLHALGHRLGVLVASPAIEADALPLGPARLGDALRNAVQRLELGLDYRVLFYRLFDRSGMTRVGEYYDTLNSYLAEQRILAHLQYRAPRYKPGHEDASVPPATEPALAGGQIHEAPAASLPHGGGVMPHAGFGMPDTGVGMQDQRDSELFVTLRELLAGRRHALGMDAPPTPRDSYIAGREDLQSVLGTLQHRPTAPMKIGGKLVPRGIAHLKQDLLAQLRQHGPAGKPPVLAEEDSDTIDLVGMLFDFITRNLSPESRSQTLLTKLQVPVLRVALRDKTFFTHRDHPARRMLNTIAETSTYWLDDEADSGLVEKMQLLVDRVTSDFSGDLGLFEGMLDDLHQHMNLLARRAEVAERRHVEAAKGREKLHAARESARTAMARLLGQGKASSFMRTLLEQPWTDVLALTLLREGEDSPAYRRRLAVADQLMRRGNVADTPADATLRSEVERGLAQVGLHQDDVRALVHKLFQPHAQADDDSSTQTQLAMKLKARPRLGEPAAPAPVERPKPAAAVLSAEERRTLEHLRNLPFGTWFEFVTNQQGASVRRKLAWYSTLTGRCLFVNQRGARADERSLEQLARDVVRGQIRFAPADGESLIDRAWKAIVGTLRQFASTTPQPNPT